MPTTVTNTIGTSSRNYSTLQAWEDACPANLVTDDKIWRGECYNDSEFTTAGNNLLSMGGITTDSTRYLELTAASGQSFADHANKTTNALDYNQSYGVAIRTTGSYGNGAVGLNSYARLSRVQIKADASNSYTLDCGGNNRITGCIIRNAASSANKPIVFFSSSDHLINCLLIGAAGLQVQGTPTLHNCTVIGNGGTAFQCSYGATVVATNTAVYNFTSMIGGSGGFTSGSNYNSTDLSAPTNWGANSQASKTFSSQFQNTTTDFRTKSTADLVGAGTREQTYTADLDIIGSARSTTVPWIGAFEIAAGGGATLIELTAAGFNWTKNPIQNRLTGTLSTPALGMNAQSIQNRSTITATLAGLSFAAQSIQNRVSATLTATSLKFVAHAINVANGAAIIVIELTTAAFNYSAKALQFSQRMTMTAAAWAFSSNPIQNRATVPLTAAALNFVTKVLQNKLTIGLTVASFSFIAWALDVTGAVASVVARLLTLLGVGS